MRYIQVAVLLIFLAAAFIFALQNTQPVKVQFLSWSISPPVPILIVVSYLLGMWTGGNLTAFIRRSIHRASERRN